MISQLSHESGQLFRWSSLRISHVAAIKVSARVAVIWDFTGSGWSISELTWLLTEGYDSLISVPLPRTSVYGLVPLRWVMWERWREAGSRRKKRESIVFYQTESIVFYQYNLILDVMYHQPYSNGHVNQTLMQHEKESYKGAKTRVWNYWGPLQGCTGRVLSKCIGWADFHTCDNSTGCFVKNKMETIKSGNK